MPLSGQCECRIYHPLCVEPATELCKVCQRYFCEACFRTPQHHDCKPAQPSDLLEQIPVLDSEPLHLPVPDEEDELVVA